MKNSILILILAALVSFSMPTPARALSIGFSTGTFDVVNGGTYTTDVVLNDWTSGDVVSAFDLDVLYSSSLLGVSSVTFSDWLGDPDFFEVLQSVHTTTSGLIDFAAVSLLSDDDLRSLQSSFLGSSIPLATLTFAGLGSGNTTLLFDWYVGQDVKGANNEVVAGYVPEPATLLLLGSGLVAMIGVRRRSSARTKINSNNDSEV